MKNFWVMFFKDPETGSIHGTAQGHNCVADCLDNPYFIGCKMITVNLKKLEK